MELMQLQLQKEKYYVIFGEEKMFLSDTDEF